MLTKTIKWLSIAVLLMAVLSWAAAGKYQAAGELGVFMGAIIVASQALRSREFLCAAGFAVVAAVFNPVFLVFRTTGLLFHVVILICTATVVIGLLGSSMRPRLSMASITSRSPRTPAL